MNEHEKSSRHAEKVVCARAPVFQKCRVPSSLEDVPVQSSGGCCSEQQSRVGQLAGNSTTTLGGLFNKNREHSPRNTQRVYPSIDCSIFWGACHDLASCETRRHASGLASSLPSSTDLSRFMTASVVAFGISSKSPAIRRKVCVSLEKRYTCENMKPPKARRTGKCVQLILILLAGKQTRNQEMAGSAAGLWQD